jgi:hypothetical protein
MWIQSSSRIYGLSKFFRLAQAYDSLGNWYQTAFTLLHVHKWNMEYFENLPVYEKHIYLDLLSQYVKHQDDLAREAQQAKKRQASKRKL